MRDRKQTSLNEFIDTLREALGLHPIPQSNGGWFRGSQTANGRAQSKRPRGNKRRDAHPSGDARDVEIDGIPE